MKFKTKIVNLRALATEAGISEHKVYRRKYVADSKPLSLNDRTKLVNALTKETVKLSKELGFAINLSIQENLSPRQRQEQP